MTMRSASMLLLSLSLVGASALRVPHSSSSFLLARSAEVKEVEGIRVGDVRPGDWRAEQRLHPDVNDPLASAKIASPGSTHGTVSASMKCIMALTMIYFVSCLMLGFVRTYNSLNSRLTSPLQGVLQHTFLSLTYAPMIAALLIAQRMRAMYLSGGTMREVDGLGPPVMMAAVACLLGQALMSLIIPAIVSGTTAWRSCLNTTFHSLRYFMILGMHASVVYIIVATISIQPTAGMFKNTPPVAPAVDCTINLTVQYFIVCLLFDMIKTHNLIKGRDDPREGWTPVLGLCAHSVAFAPMIAILFIGARMRALQIDPVHGSPQGWAQACFYICTYAVLAQTITALVGTMLGAKPIRGLTEGDVTFQTESPCLRTCMKTLQYTVMAVLYVGVVLVMYSVIEIQDPRGHEHTPAISPAMQCVLNLTVQFFGTCFAQWLAVSSKDVLREWSDLSLVIMTLDAARLTVQYAPMLSVLFIGARMRALAMAEGDCGPQSWAQDCMFLATNQLLLQLVMVLVFPYLADGTVEVDEDGVPKGSAVRNVTVGGLIEFLRYISTSVMYGSITALCVAMVTLTPETANCRAPPNFRLATMEIEGPSLWVILTNWMMLTPVLMLVVARCCRCY